MAKGGFPGGMNMQNMMRQAQQMQQNIAKMQAELEEREVETSAVGGVVKVVVTGKKVLKSIEIAPEAVDPDDVEMLQDMVVAAVNEAYKSVESKNAAEMEKITGSLSLPGGMF